MMLRNIHAEWGENDTHASEVLNKCLWTLVSLLLLEGWTVPQNLKLMSSSFDLATDLSFGLGKSI